MTKKLILGIVLMLSFSMVSCGSNKQPANSSSDSASSSSSSSENITASTSEDKKENETSSNSSTSSNDKDASSEEGTKMPIYTVDVNTYEPNEETTVTVKPNASLEDKLKAVAKSVSETSFNGLPIEVKSIDTVDGKKVATINLTDSGDKKWSQKFQGSAGGQITASTLIENFLQTNNKSNDEWIDGVKFLYNNETIEYEHASELSNIKYR